MREIIIFWLSYIQIEKIKQIQMKQNSPNTQRIQDVHQYTPECFYLYKPIEPAQTSSISNQFIGKDKMYFSGNQTVSFIYENQLFLLGRTCNSGKFINQNNNQTVNNSNQNQSKMSLQQIRIPCFDLINNQWQSFSLSILNYQSLSRSYQFYPPIQSKANQLQQTKNPSPILYLPVTLSNVSLCQSNINPEIVYIYGGVYLPMYQYTDKLWKINLKHHTIQLLKQQGQKPQLRQTPTLLQFNENYLILYGGYNLKNCTIYNQFHCLSISTLNWYLIESHFANLLSPRIHPSLSLNPLTKQLYLFGGMIHDHNGHQRLLNDMYMFSLEDMDSPQKKNKKYKGTLTCKTILPQLYENFPQRRAGHKSTWINYHLLIMTGGQKEIQTTEFLNQEQKVFNKKNYHNDVWIFDTKTSKWTELIPWDIQNSLIERPYIGMQFYKTVRNGIHELVVIDRGEQSNQNHGDFDFGRLKVDVRQLQESLSKEKTNKVAKECQVCELNKNDKGIERRKQTFPVDLIDSVILNGMSFPFSAFSHIVHHSIQRQAASIQITYNQYPHYSQTQNELIIEDDSLFPYTAEQVYPRIHIFGNKDLNDIIGVSDKKYKTLHSKQNALVQFTNQLKIAALRLGQEFIWIANNINNQILIFMVKKTNLPKDKSTQPLQQQAIQQFYESYFYALDANTLQMFPQYSQSVRDQVMTHYSQAIQSFIKNKRSTGSTLRIKKLRKIFGKNEKGQITQKYEITPLADKNTLIIERQFLNQIQNQKLKDIAFQQSIDINLRPYLSMLYLNRYAKISMKVNRLTTDKNFKPILVQSYPKSNIQNHKQQPNINIINQTSKQLHYMPEHNKQISIRKSSFVEKVSQVVESYSKSKLPKAYPHFLKLRSKTHRKRKVIFNKQISQTLSRRFPLNLCSPKIDSLIQAEQLIQVDLDVFGQFDCKIIEVYYWKNRHLHIRRSPESQQLKTLPLHQQQLKPQMNSEDKIKLISYQNKNIKNQNVSQTFNDETPLLFPNGLLIYHKNRLVKRYCPPLGVLSPLFKSPVSHLIGVIQINQKTPTNVFGTSFVNEETNLQTLYARIQHVAHLYNRMYPPQSTTNKRQRQTYKQKSKYYSNIQIDKIKPIINLSVVMAQQHSQKIQAKKKLKLQ